MFLWIVGGPQTRLDLDPSANHMCSKARGRPCWMVYRRGNSVTSYNLPIFFFFLPQSISTFVPKLLVAITSSN